MIEYKRQLDKGAIQKAYRGLMEYLMGLRKHFVKAYPHYGVSASLYFGYMDMTYFSIVPPAIKAHKLKIPIVFLHEVYRFEVWLSGANRGVQTKYWKKITERGWEKFKVVPQGKWADSIVECILVEDPDFGDLGALTQQIELGTVAFIRDVENFLSTI